MEEAILAFYIYMEVFGLSLNKNTDPHPKKIRISWEAL